MSSLQKKSHNKIIMSRYKTMRKISWLQLLFIIIKSLKLIISVGAIILSPYAHHVKLLVIFSKCHFNRVSSLYLGENFPVGEKNPPSRRYNGLCKQSILGHLVFSFLVSNTLCLSSFGPKMWNAKC